MLMFADVCCRMLAGEDGHAVTAFGRSAPDILESDDCIVCIAPASSEMEQLKKVAERAAGEGLDRASIEHQ